MISKVLRFSLISLLLLLLAIPAIAAKTLTLESIEGRGTVFYNSHWTGTGGDWYELTANSSLTVADFEVVPLKAEPAPGYESIPTWFGDAAKTGAVDSHILMSNENRRFSVLFTPINLVTVNIAGSGTGYISLSDGTHSCTIPQEGIDCAFADDSKVTLQATPTNGSSFGGWMGDAAGSSATTTLLVGTEDLEVTASFASAASTTHTLSIEFRGDGSGSVNVDGTVISKSQTFIISAGETITLMATPTAGSNFGGWTGAKTSSSIGITLTVDGDKALQVLFDDPAASSVIAGCATSVGANYSGSFDANDFSLINVSVVDDPDPSIEKSYLQLETVTKNNSFIIPFEQEVFVTFVSENSTFSGIDLGWFYADEDPTAVASRPIYSDINDNNNDGALDKAPLDPTPLFSDANGDGEFNALDNRISLGTFAAGEEIVFALTVANVGDKKPPTFYSKVAWNEDTWGPNGTEEGNCIPDPITDTFTKTYHLEPPLSALDEGVCAVDSNWMIQDSIDRLSNLFSLNFAAGDNETFNIVRDKNFPHVLAATPADNPNQLVLGWEEQESGGDTDHNDLIFLLERKSGGSAQLLPTAAITPLETDAFFNAVTMEVIDELPGNGDSLISYQVSVDGGSNWVSVSNWDIVKTYPNDGNGNPDTTADLKTAGVDITASWSPGTPETSYRSVRIDFAGLDLTGAQLIWRAVFSSNNLNYQPTIKNVQLDAEVATHGEISRSSPIIQSNLLYEAGYETPANSWLDKELRGHLRAMRIYDPTNTSFTDNVVLWDAGEVLQGKEPKSRTIKYPEMSVSAHTENIATGDGSRKTFTGVLSALNNQPDLHLLATTLKISAGTESFTDTDINRLVGDLGIAGTIDRATGEYSVTFDQPPATGVNVVAAYSTYSTTGQLKSFDTLGSNTPDEVLAIDGTSISSGDWLVNWVRGYKDGIATKKEWILGPIDHSTPAMVSPPGRPSWYYGTAISLAERADYDTFKDTHSERRTVVVVGSRDGMLHAFDAGAFRWGNNKLNAKTVEKRGHFAWADSSLSNYTEVVSWWDDFFLSLGTNIDPPYFGWDDSGGKNPPDYGTGEEVWAFIPANLMPRLKNNVLGGNDRAYVDASSSIADVYIDIGNGKEWRTVLLSAQGNGGDSIFCLDVTDTQSPTFLWEYSDPDLFRSRSSPAIASIGRIYDINANETKWVAFFVSGRNYDLNSFPAIFMVDIETGKMLRKIELDTTDAGKGGVPSGQPAIVDSDGNGYIDRAYIGTDKGYLYKVNLPDSPTSKGSLSVLLVNVDFTDENNETVPSSQRYHPIYGAPSVVVDNGLSSDGTIDYNVRIFFGTGDSPYYDENINTGNTRYHFFAYNDKAAKGDNSQNGIRLEWFFELPAGHRIFASAFAAAGTIYFGSATGETENPCEGPNEGRLYAFTYKGNSVLNDSLGKEGMRVGDIYSSPVVEDEHLYLRTPDGVKSFGDGKYNNDVKKGGLPTTKATYWREIF